MMKKMTTISLVTVLLSLLSLDKLTGQVSLTNAAASALIDFSNTTPTSIGSTPATAYAAAGFSANPTTAGRLNSNAWALTGWTDGSVTFGGSNTTGDYIRGATAVAVTSGGMYAYTGAPGSAANPAMMIQPGGGDFAPGTLTLRIVNNGTTAINSFTISYDLYVRNDQARSSSFNFSYSLDNSSYTAVSSLDYTSGAALDALGWVKVGTSPSRSTVVNSLNIAPGAFFYIRWSSNDVAGSGSRDELGLDDIAINAAFVANPSFNVTNNGLQPTAASILQGSNKNMLQRFVLRETNVAAGTLDAVTIPLTGTYMASDINAAGLKLYTSTTNNFASATVLSGTASLAAGSGESVSFNSLGYAVAQNSTQYFWVTADIDAVATIGNTIRATALNAGNFSFAAGTVTATVNQGGIQTIAAPVPSLSISNNGSQPAAAQVLQNTTDHLLQSFVVTEGNVAAGTLNNVAVPLAGTYSASDVSGTGFKLYTSATNNFTSATVLSSKASVAAGSGETVNFNSLNYAIAKNSTQYFWVTVDIDVAAIAGNTMNASALSAGNFTFAAGSVIASVSAGGVQTITALTPSLNVTDNGSQPVAALVVQNTNDNLLQSFVVTEGNVAAATLNVVTVPLAGTYSTADIKSSGLKLYVSTTNNFASASVLSSITSSSSGSGETALFNGVNYAIAKNSTHYFWVTADIANSATVGNTINASALSAGNFSFTSASPTVSVNAGGVQTIDAPLMTTQLLPAYCGYTAQSFGEFIGADPVPNATHYLFQLENAASSYTQTFASGYPYLTLYTIPGISYNTTYTVTVAWSPDGVTWSNYGSPCTITSPLNEVTELQPAYCGFTASSYSQVIYANRVSGATQYEYRLINSAASYTQTFVKTNNNFNLSQFSGLQPGTTYSVSLRVFIFGAWDIYGTSCNVTTPSSVSTTSLQPASCGITAASYAQVLYAVAVTGATQYEYRLVNAAASYTQTLVKSNNNFNLTQFAGLTNGTTYSVSVRANVSGVWGSFGPICTVATPASSPTTSLQPSSCGITASSYTQVLYAVAVTGATQYEYKLENAAASYTQTFVKSNNNFNLAQFTGLANSTAYNVQVRVFFNGVWGNYGSICSVTTPASALMLNGNTGMASREGVENADNTLLENSFDAMAYPNPFDKEFSLNLLSYTVNEPVHIRVYDATGKLVEQHDLSPESVRELSIGTTYAEGLYNILVSQGTQHKSIKVIRQ